MFRLSLLIATYNRAAQMVTTLESVVRQDLPSAEWECIVVDNNSADDTQARFAAFAARYPGLNLRMVTETGQGVSCARNRGVVESSGEYVAIIDDDERIARGFVRSYVEFFDAHPAAAVAGGPIVAEYLAGRPAWMSKYTERPIANPMNFGSRVRLFPKGRIPGGGNMAFRRSVADRYGLFDPSLGRTGQTLTGGEESDFFERLQRAGESLWYVPGAVMWHLIPPEKLTADYFRRLCYNIGRSQRRRAEIHDRLLRTRVLELFKWPATLALCCTLTPLQARWLLRMRREITRGLFKAAMYG